MLQHVRFVFLDLQTSHTVMENLNSIVTPDAVIIFWASNIKVGRCKSIYG
ncbi:unnamed protein product [Rhodiola kirilowii]